MKIDRSILPPGRIGIAVSGGSDSVALAFLLTKGGKKKNAAARFAILHVDHGIRKESKEEYQFVKSLAGRLGVPFKGVHLKVRKVKGESLEMAARRVRLAFFADCMERLGLDAIATGHHMDDLAETFLMKLRRASLCGMRETSDVGCIRFVRPLLWCRDKANTWESELVCGEAPTTISGEKIPFSSRKSRRIILFQTGHIRDT